MNPHYPLTCQENKFWFMENNFQYREDYVWISKNCKKCPKCKWSIQKNEGCNHMTCRLCHHEFCWLCFQNYQGHNNALCNKLAAEKQMQKQKNFLIMKQISRKADLMKSQNKFLESQKEKELQFLKIIKNAKENVKTEGLFRDFKKLEEIYGFLFISSKIKGMFFPNEEEKKRIEKKQEEFLKKIQKAENKLATQKTISAELKDVEKYVEGIETELSNLRKGVALDEILSYQLGE